jgi:dihydroxyacetone kinase-like predicted kinase
MHSSASTYAAFSDPVEGAFLSIMLEQEKEIRRLKGRE